MTAAFVAICLIWGATWIPMKYGVATVPPLFFAGTRFLAAGIVLLLLARMRGRARRLTGAEVRRLALVQLLMVVMTYGPLFWALLVVPSGLAAVLDMALTPVSLLVFGIMLGEERLTLRRGLALATGFAGLAVLYGPQVVAPTDIEGLLGAAAIAASAAAYCLGSVIARPLTGTTDAIYLSGLTMLPGGAALTLAAFVFEPGAMHAARFDWTAPALAGWLFLLVFGSLFAFTAYLRLLAVWGPARAGSFAYVSPVIAVLLGVVVLGERVGLRDGIGMALLLGAAFFSVGAGATRPAASPSPPSGRTAAAAAAAPGRARR
jgi:drug/metabolite transporter (DMT)-like permease